MVLAHISITLGNGKQLSNKQCAYILLNFLDKALEWQKIRHWRPKKDSTQLRSAMAVRQNCSSFHDFFYIFISIHTQVMN